MKKKENKKTPIISPTFYPLLIDENRGKVLSIMMEICLKLEPVLKHSLNMEFVEQDFVNLMHEISEKEHALGWCKDPECDWKPKEIKKVGINKNNLKQIYERNQKANEEGK